MKVGKRTDGESLQTKLKLNLKTKLEANLKKLPKRWEEIDSGMKDKLKSNNKFPVVMESEFQELLSKISKYQGPLWYLSSPKIQTRQLLGGYVSEEVGHWLYTLVEAVQVWSCTCLVLFTHACLPLIHVPLSGSKAIILQQWVATSMYEFDGYGPKPAQGYYERHF